jgi:hypothetical protein
MKRFLLFELLIAIILFNGCTKNPNTTTNPQPSFKVKTLKEEITRSDSFHYISTATLSYDSQDRLIKMESDSSRSIFAYENNLVKKDLYQTGSPDQHFYYYLNSNSLLDSLVLYYGTTDTSHVNYYYNSKEQMIKIISTYVNRWGARKDTVSYEYNNNGDIAKIIQGYSVNSYEYYDKPNFQNSVSMLFPGTALNPDLLKTSYYTYTGGHATTQNFTYNFDDYNRIVTITDLSTSDFYSETFTTTYTYY